MAPLNVKKPPDVLDARLKSRAKRQRRSVAQEVAVLLATALDTPEPLSILDLQGLGKDLWRRIGLIDDLGSGRIGVDTALTHRRSVRVADLPRDLLHRAAQLRARAALRTPDALQLAAAQQAGRATFLTNDRCLPSVPGLRIVQLEHDVA